jgi:hypothetical protein
MSDFSKLKLEQLQLVLKTGSLDSVPIEYREYYDLMDFVRGLASKNTYNGALAPKSKIIRLIKQTKDLSDYQARILYNDAINFFYCDTAIKKESFANLYAERLEDAALLAIKTGQLDVYKDLIKEAAKLRGCYDKKTPTIPEELYRKQFVVYTTDVTDLGGVPTDTKELEKQIDKLPDVPVMVKDRLKMEGGITKFDLFKIIAEDADTFNDENNS